MKKITSEDRQELMELEYRIGKLELGTTIRYSGSLNSFLTENMELEQSRIVHESLVRGKDLTIQKLQLQLQVCFVFQLLS